MPQQLEARPPYATFENRPIEDRAASDAAGHTVYRDLAYIIVTPQGSKDRYERVATEWFDQKQQEVQEGRFPAEWLQAYRKQFQMWQEGQEIPENGTAIRNWPPATQAQVKTLLGIGVRTVEDLALANEETLSRIGMGARNLQAQARNFLEAAKSTGTISMQMTALQEENEQLKIAMKRQEEQIQLLLARVPEKVEAAALEQVAPTQQRGAGIQINDLVDPPQPTNLRPL